MSTQNNSLASVDKYAVVGNPIAHSMSPDIHLLFADQTGEKIQYEKILAEKSSITRTFKEFFANGGKGLNITVPFKTDAYDFVDEVSNYAKNAGAVNTIVLQDNGKLLGANTDGLGLLRDLKKRLRLQLEEKKILILGAGGATQGIVEPLLQENPAELMIANRTLQKAEDIVQRFMSYKVLHSCALNKIPDITYDVVLHATSVGLQQANLDLPEVIIGTNTCCYDLLYSDSDTAFMQWCKSQHASKVYDGFGMLLEQAAEAFYLWRNQRPDTAMAYHYFRPNTTPKPSL